MPISSVSLSLLGLTVLLAAGCGGAESRKAKHLEKGQALLVAENFEKARIEFQNALQISPKDAEARFEMGVVAERLNNPKEAAQFYQGTIDVDPENIGARTKLARLYLLSGAPERALDLLAPALVKQADNAELLTIRAAARLQQKNTSEALADALRAVRLEPTNEDAVAVLAGIYTSSGAPEKAQALLEQSIQRIPATVDLRIALAELYAQQHRDAESEALLIKLVELRPKDKAHRLRLAQYYSRLKQLDAAETTLRQAIKAAPADRDLKLALIDFLAACRSREIAEKELKNMAAAAPDDSELKFALARFYDAGKQPALAEAIYQSIIVKEKLDAAGLSARNRLALLRAQRGDETGALALLNEVLAKSPRDDDALLLRGNMAFAKQNPRAAIADLRAVLRDQPNAVGVLRILARAHLANGERAVAEETMRHAVDINPNDVALRLEFAQFLFQLGKADQAKPILMELVKQRPDNIDALNTQFRVAMATKDFITARSAAESLVAASPKSAIGYLYEGILAEVQKHNDEALRLYTAAADLEPTGAEPLQAEIRLLVEMKRVPEALKRLDAFTARYPTDSFALNMKGDVLLTNARQVEAREAFQAAIVRTPKWWKPYRGLAYAELAAKDQDAAIATMRNAEANVDQPDMLGAELAAILEQIGRPEQAIGEYEAIIRRSPDSEVAANNLAMLLASYRTDPASLDRAKQLSVGFANSANPSLLDTYGWVLYKRGETASSIPVLTRVVEKAPDQALARYHLGMAQSQAGNTSDARDNLMRAVNSGTKFAGLDEAKAALAKLPATAKPST